MMSHVERRDHAREILRTWSGEDHSGGRLVVTTPGCNEFLHVAQVLGAGVALKIYGPWSGWTVMDCGCSLAVLRRSDLTTGDHE
jgi:hypothetical protein